MGNRAKKNGETPIIKNSKSALFYIFDIVFWVFIAVTSFIFVKLVVLNDPFFFGQAVIVMQSDELEPQINKGDYLSYKKDISSVEVGDILVFENQNSMYLQKIVEIKENTFVCRDNSSELEILKQQVSGVITKNDKLANFVMFSLSWYGLVIWFGVPGLLALTTIIIILVEESNKIINDKTKTKIKREDKKSQDSKTKEDQIGTVECLEEDTGEQTEGVLIDEKTDATGIEDGKDEALIAEQKIDTNAEEKSQNYEEVERKEKDLQVVLEKPTNKNELSSVNDEFDGDWWND